MSKDSIYAGEDNKWEANFAAGFNDMLYGCGNTETVETKPNVSPPDSVVNDEKTSLPPWKFGGMSRVGAADNRPIPSSYYNRYGAASSLPTSILAKRRPKTPPITIPGSSLSPRWRRHNHKFSCRPPGTKAHYRPANNPNNRSGERKAVLSPPAVPETSPASSPTFGR